MDECLAGAALVVMNRWIWTRRCGTFGKSGVYGVRHGTVNDGYVGVDV